MNTSDIKIRDAIHEDKSQALEFCQKTFSWGDYVQEAWDYWIQERNSRLLVAEHNTTKRPVAFCHVTFLESVVWIEGIRVDPDYRNKGIAKKLVQTSEKLAIEKNCICCCMLVANSNKPSLSLAKNSNYSIFQTWYYYNINNEKGQMSRSTSFHLAKTPKEIPSILHNTQSLFFVKSWRWIPLNNILVDSLVSADRLLISQRYPNSFAILTESKRYKGKVLVTAYCESDEASLELLVFLDSLLNKKYTQVEILSKTILPDVPYLERETEFHLLRKILY